MSETLNELSERYQEAYQRMVEMNVEEGVIKDTLVDIEDDIKNKADSYATVINKLKEEANYAEEHEKKWQTRKRVLNNQIKQMKENLSYQLQVTHNTNFRTQDWHFWIQKNTPKLVLDEKQLDVDYLKTEYVPDKDKIKDALKKGKNVNGAKLEQTESVRIR